MEQPRLCRLSAGHSLQANYKEIVDPGPVAPPTDPLLQLVSLQKASGSWPLAPDLAAALGKSSEEVDDSRPAGVSDLQQEAAREVQSVQAPSFLPSRHAGRAGSVGHRPGSGLASRLQAGLPGRVGAAGHEGRGMAS